MRWCGRLASSGRESLGWPQTAVIPSTGPARLVRFGAALCLRSMQNRGRCFSPLVQTGIFSSLRYHRPDSSNPRSVQPRAGAVGRPQVAGIPSAVPVHLTNEAVQPRADAVLKSRLGLKYHKPWYRRFDLSHTRSVQLRVGAFGQPQAVVIPSADPACFARAVQLRAGAVHHSWLV